MKTLLIAVCLALVPAGLAAQQRQTQAGATAVPPLAAPPAPLAPAAEAAAGPALPPALAPNPNALRLYVENLQGPDASQIAGLIEQNLFESKQVVVTENASNANLVLKGTIYRRLIPQRAVAKTRRRPRHGASATRPATAGLQGPDDNGVTFVNPKTIPDANSPTDGAMVDGAMAADSGGNSYDSGQEYENQELLSLGSLANPGITDLGKYQYRLDLELVDPNGDLIWISSRGLNGPSFSSANDAVEASLQPMLKLLEKTTKNSGAASQPASH